MSYLFLSCTEVIIVKSDTEFGVDLEEVVTFQKHLKTILKPLI